jgi:hypothetical protein
MGVVLLLKGVREIFRVVVHQHGILQSAADDTSEAPEVSGRPLNRRPDFRPLAGKNGRTSMLYPDVAKAGEHQSTAPPRAQPLAWQAQDRDLASSGFSLMAIHLVGDSLNDFFPKLNPQCCNSRRLWAENLSAIFFMQHRALATTLGQGNFRNMTTAAAALCLAAPRF